jgi:hypothetical protein
MADDSTRYARVFVKHAGFYRTFEHADGRVQQRYDPSALTYLISEFVALSAVEIAISPRSPARLFLSQLPAQLADRVVLLDKNGEVRREHAAILQPLIDEFGLRLTDDGLLEIPGTAPPQLSPALRIVHPGLFDFLLAGRYHTQLELDVEGLIKAADVIRKTSRVPEVLAFFSSFIGVLSTYRALEAPSLALVSTSTEQLQQQFKALVEDTAYRRLSASAAFLGVPADATRALRLMSRGVSAILKRPWLSQSAKAATKAILTSTGLPTPDVDVAGLVIPSGYFPPIVSFGEAYARAETWWRSRRLPAAEIELYDRLTRDGFTERLDAAQPTFAEMHGGTKYLFRPEDEGRS